VGKKTDCSWGECSEGTPNRSSYCSDLAIAAISTNYMLAMQIGVAMRIGWAKPPEGKIMVNMDASFDPVSSAGSTGVIIRD
jgi:hypothetical protein